MLNNQIAVGVCFDLFSTNIHQHYKHTNDYFKQLTDELCQPDKAFSGYLFSHGPQGLPDSLDVSISTTGYEDGDDFPHCIGTNTSS